MGGWKSGTLCPGVLLSVWLSRVVSLLGLFSIVAGPLDGWFKAPKAQKQNWPGLQGSGLELAPPTTSAFIGLSILHSPTQTPCGRDLQRHE